MKSFTITEEQIARVIGTAIADELSRTFNRHVDFLTTASWNEKTPLGRGGIGLNEDEVKVCWARLAALFGAPAEGGAFSETMLIADLAAKLAATSSEKLNAFTFASAMRNHNGADHTHRADEIFQDAAAAANLFYGRRRLLSLVAPHGLLGFVLSVLTPNLQHIASVDARRMTPDTLSQSLMFGDLLAATPTLWRYMMREKLKAPENTMAVSFGEPMTADLAREMREAGFGVMRELYGSTETGLIGWRESTTEPFALFDHWRRDGDDLIRMAPDGTQRPVKAMDTIEWTSQKAFHLGGRRDGAVQIGAVNVFPDQVAAALRDHPSVADCRVRAGRRGDGVNRLIAHIVLKPQFQPNEQTARDIDAWCRKKLRQQERPRIFNFEAALEAK